MSTALPHLVARTGISIATDDTAVNSNEQALSHPLTQAVHREGAASTYSSALIHGDGGWQWCRREDKMGESSEGTKLLGATVSKVQPWHERFARQTAALLKKNGAKAYLNPVCPCALPTYSR